MTFRTVTTMTSIVLVSACAIGTPSRTAEERRADAALARDFAEDAIDAIGSNIAPCDSAAINDRSTDWICAEYTQSHTEFIEDWNELARSDDFRTKYNIIASSGWMYFEDRKGIDFYGKLYRVQNTKALIAYDPSEKGREIFIGMSPVMDRIMRAASGSIHSIEPAAESGRKKYPVGAYNCEDFATRADARRFFNSEGFSATYDPYGLDADNNGIPCESIGEVASDSSECPRGESWVAPYTRSNGSRVRGHCRKRR